jgi:hypothetical protein
MANKKRTVDAVIADAERLAKVWAENPTFSMGEVLLDGLKADIAKLGALKQALDEARVDVSALINKTHDQTKLVESHIVRGKSGMSSVFGRDSVQYAQVGGTRQSERKSPSPKKPKTP